MSLEIGDTAPDFALAASGEQTLSLSALRGRKIVLYFYPKDDTSGCTKEAIAFNGLLGQFAGENTEIIGISADSVKSHNAFCSKYSLAFPLASDEKKETLAAYGVWVEKSMYGRKYFGSERATFLIDEEGKIAQIWRKVKVPGHAEAVLKAAQALTLKE